MTSQLPPGAVLNASLAASPPSGGRIPVNSVPSPGRIFAKGSVPYRGHWYCSLREAQCSAMIQEFVPGFLPIPGETIQIPIGFGRSVDFRLHGAFIEYHEPRVFVSSKKLGEYESWFEYRAFLRELDRTRRQRRDAVLDRQRRMLLDRYSARRRRALDENPGSRGAELLVVHDFDSIYDQVIFRFSPLCGEGSREQARILYRDIERRIVQDLNSRARGQAIAA